MENLPPPGAMQYCSTQTQCQPTMQITNFEPGKLASCADRLAKRHAHACSACFLCITSVFTIACASLSLSVDGLAESILNDSGTVRLSLPVGVGQSFLLKLSLLLKLLGERLEHTSVEFSSLRPGERNFLGQEVRQDVDELSITALVQLWLIQELGLI